MIFLVENSHSRNWHSIFLNDFNQLTLYKNSKAKIRCSKTISPINNAPGLSNSQRSQQMELKIVGRIAGFLPGWRFLRAFLGLNVDLVDFYDKKFGRHWLKMGTRRAIPSRSFSGLITEYLSTK